MSGILLKIKRAFTHDESINYLLGELKKAKFEIGVKNSEIEELKYYSHILESSNKKLSKQLKRETEPLTKEDLKEQRFTEMNRELYRKRRKILKLEGDVDLWRSKWLNDVAKNSKE